MTANLHITKGKYYTVVLSWYDESHNRKQKSVNTGITTAEKYAERRAKARMEEIKDEWKNKIHLCNHDGSLLFGDYMDYWLESIEKRSIQATTFHTYRQNVNVIMRYFNQRKIKLSDLKARDIQDFYSYKMDETNVSPNTVYRYHANIRKALSYAVKTERIQSNPADKVTLPRKQKHKPQFYSAEEIKTLLEKVRGQKIEPVVVLSACFGLRLSEALGLKWEYIDFENRTLTIAGVIGRINGVEFYKEETKTKSSYRTLSIPQIAMDYLIELRELQERNQKRYGKKYNKKDAEFVCLTKCGHRIQKQYVSKTFPRICEECGLKPMHFHGLRHSNISILLNSGAGIKELQEWAGHSNYSTTADIYAHLLPDSNRRLAVSLEYALR